MTLHDILVAGLFLAAALLLTWLVMPVVFAAVQWPWRNKFWRK